MAGDIPHRQFQETVQQRLGYTVNFSRLCIFRINSGKYHLQPGILSVILDRRQGISPGNNNITYKYVSIMAKNNSNTPKQPDRGPQYSLDDLYFTVFNERRKYDEDGYPYYIPIEKNTRPTGVRVMDNFMNYLNEGYSSISSFCKTEGVNETDFSRMCKVLTGMKALEFKIRWTERTVVDLLRYTNLSPAEVADRSGVGSHNNMCIACKRVTGRSSRDFRNYEREERDVGLYRI